MNKADFIEQKELLGNNEKKEPPEMFCKRGGLRNFAKFTGKPLCQGLFLNKISIYLHLY